MNLGHRQEVRSSWEGAGSQSQGLAYVQPVQDSLSVRSLYANGLPEGNNSKPEPLPFPTQPL